MQKLTHTEQSNSNAQENKQKEIKLRIMSKNVLPERMSGNITVTYTS